MARVRKNSKDALDEKIEKAEADVIATKHFLLCRFKSSGCGRLYDICASRMDS